jgi:pyruvate formate lyase activating enzyme
VAVTAGYIMPEARREFYAHMDAANVDLKGFTKEFYHQQCFAELDEVLETLVFLKRETQVWFEVTTLLIPGANDSAEEIDRASDWYAQNLGADVPWHFTAFHPDFKMLDRPNTPPETLTRARQIAMSKGIRYVYTGNVHDVDGGSTYCPGCRRRVVGRNWHQLTEWNIRNGACGFCGTPIAGHFPNIPGNWGARRVPIKFQRQ